jgi:hypothetical protein
VYYGGVTWLLLLHQIPPKPAYFRAQVLRRLGQLGALPVKNSAYLLPDTTETLEDFQWICQEITAQGGSAWLFRIETIAGTSDEAIWDGFRQLREADYQKLINEAEALLHESELSFSELASAHGKLARRAQEIQKIEFVTPPSKQEWEKLMIEIERSLHATVDARSAREKLPQLNEPQGRAWVTRRGVKIDRIGSAWLIRRFIDTRASFRFVEPKSYQWQEGELRFDMFEGEFTHQGELCTFEVLAASLPPDAALQAIAEIVHDIDLKEERYQHPEAAGIARLIDGICSRWVDDDVRLERGGALFDALYESFQKG